jgi:hypothetical protein
VRRSRRSVDGLDTVQLPGVLRLPQLEVELLVRDALRHEGQRVGGQLQFLAELARRDGLPSLERLDRQSGAKSDSLLMQMSTK